MISPIIKWDHSEDLYVASFGTRKFKKSAERKVKVSLSDPEYEFMSGHCIDGKIFSSFFPKHLV